MLQGIDHIAIVVPDLETAIRNYTSLGFTVVPGGRHPTGTHNALIGFQDGAYVELIGFYAPNPEDRWYQLLQKGGGLVDFCAQTDDLDKDLSSFREVGIQLSDRYPLSRIRPDGYKLDWILSVPNASQQGIVPFLIEDITPRRERVPKQVNHANKVTGIGKLTVVVQDVAQVSEWYQKVLNKRPVAIERPELEANGVELSIGSHRFNFIKPNNGGSPLRAWLNERGQGVYAVTFKTNGKPSVLDEETTLHARITLV